MIQNYLSTFFRIFRKNWIIAGINVLGLSIGMVSALLIAKYIGYSMIFNSSFENRDRIFHITQTETTDASTTYDSDGTYRGIAEYAYHEIPEVVSFTKYNWGVEQLVTIEQEGEEVKQFSQNRIFSADSSFTQIFNLTPIAGSLQGALDEPQSVILPRGTAEKYFGDINVVGRTIRSRTSWGSESIWTVTCVVENLPSSASRRFDVLVSTKETSDERWQNPGYYQYLLLRSGEDHKSVAKKITKVVNALPVFQTEGRSIRVDLMPIKPELSTLEIFLISTGVLIMVLSWISFANMSIVQFSLRQREIFIRRSIGADNSGLIRQFLFETSAIVTMAMVISILVLFMTHDYFLNLTEGHLLSLMGNQFYLNSLFVAVIVTGTLLPSSYVLSTLLGRNSDTILDAKQVRFNAGVRRRKILAGLQFGIAIVMITFTYVIDHQMKYLSGLSNGINLDEKIIIKTPRDVSHGKGRRARAFRNELSQLPWISQVSTSSTIPGQTYRNEVNFRRSETDDETLMYINVVNEQFIPAYAIDVLAGDNFPQQGGPAYRSKVLINKVSMRALGLDLSNAVGQKIVDEEQETYTIIGVIQDYHKTSPKDKVGPMIFKYNPVRGHFTINYSEDNPPGEQEYMELEAIWRQVYSELPFEYFLLSTYYDLQFTNEGQLLGVMRTFTFVVIFLACFSLIGLAIFETTNSKLEVGVRKAFGASSWTICSGILKRYLTLFLITTLIVSPAIYYFTGQWLNEFSYRIEFTPIHILMPALGLLSISFITIGFQIIKLSWLNPVKVLRER